MLFPKPKHVNSTDSSQVDADRLNQAKSRLAKLTSLEEELEKRFNKEFRSNETDPESNKPKYQLTNDKLKRCRERIEQYRELIGKNSAKTLKPCL